MIIIIMFLIININDNNKINNNNRHIYRALHLYMPTEGYRGVTLPTTDHLATASST